MKIPSRNELTPERVYIDPLLRFNTAVESDFNEDGLIKAINDYGYRWFASEKDPSGELEEYVNLNGRWHPASEPPDLRQSVLMEFVENAVVNPPLRYRVTTAIDLAHGWRPKTPLTIVRKWAYVKDLLPKGGEK